MKYEEHLLVLVILTLNIFGLKSLNPQAFFITGILIFLLLFQIQVGLETYNRRLNLYTQVLQSPKPFIWEFVVCDM